MTIIAGVVPGQGGCVTAGPRHFQKKKRALRPRPLEISLGETELLPAAQPSLTITEVVSAGT